MAQKKFRGQFWFYAFIRFVLFILNRTFFGFRCFGAENVPTDHDERGVILAPNHASYLDPPIIGISLKRPVTFLAKDYLFKAFFIGTVMRLIGALPVKSETNDFRSIRELLRVLRVGGCVSVFPEGTRSVDGGLKEAEDGIGFIALKSGAWVVPAYIEGTFDAFPRNARFFKCRPVRMFYGKAFIPAEDKEILSSPEPYKAAGRRIMADIAGIKQSRRG